MTATTVTVTLPTTEVDVPVDVAVPGDAVATLVLAHGAGAGRDHPFLTGFARALGAAGIATVRFDFPYRAAGRRLPGPAAHAIAAWRDVLAWADTRALPGAIWAAGKSYGGRMASMAAAEGAIGPAGLVYLGYPLHPPGAPEKARSAHLPAVTQRQLFVQGENDPFSRPHEQLTAAVESCPRATLHWVEGGGHSFEVKGRPRPAEEIGADLTPIVAAFIRGDG